MRAYAPENAFCGEQDIIAQIIPAHAFGVGNWIDFAKNLNKLRPLLNMLLRINDNPPSWLFFLLNWAQIFFGFDCFRDKPPCISLYKHEFQDINLFVCNPGMVKLLKVFAHVVEYILYSYIYFFHDSFINVSYDLLDHFKLSK